MDNTYQGRKKPIPIKLINRYTIINDFASLKSRKIKLNFILEFIFIISVINVFFSSILLTIVALKKRIKFLLYVSQ